MMRKCQLVGCHNEENRTLHFFPKHPSREREIWLKFCGLSFENVLKNIHLCEDHFENDCYVYDRVAVGPMKAKKRLKHDGKFFFRNYYNNVLAD